MEHFSKLMAETGFNDASTLAVSEQVLANVKAKPTAMRSTLHALAVGDNEEFLARARDLGLDKHASTLAVRDTAALAALVMQVGVIDSW